MARKTSTAQKQAALVEPVQLPLFPDRASLCRIRPERNEWRYYRMEVWPDLFGRALLVRQWGRIGTEGRRRLAALCGRPPGWQGPFRWLR
jgi:hypothetical protein